MRFLVVKPSSLGDVIHTFFVPYLIRQRYPEAEIGWIVNDSLQSLVTLNPHVNTIIPFRRRQWGSIRGVGGFFSFLRELRRAPWDVVIDFQGLLRSGLCARAAAGKKGKVWGFADAREGAGMFYSHSVAVPKQKVHAVERNLFLLNTVLDSEFPAPYVPEIPIPEDLRRAVREMIAIGDEEQLLCIAPLSRWTTKNWPAACYVETARQVLLRHPNVHVALIGSADDASLGDLMASEMATAGPGRIWNLCGRTPDLGCLTALLKRANVLLTNDSGPMHLAALVGTPMVAIFGPTSPAKTGPYTRAARILQDTTLECVPCFQRKCKLGDHRCMGNVTVETVVAAVSDKLSG